MVAPNAAGASFDVLLQFSLDEEANKRVQSRTSTIKEELKRIQDQAKKTGKAINESMNNIDTRTGKVTTSVTQLGVQMAKLGERAKTGTKETNQAIDTTIRKFKQLEDAAKRARQQSAMISGAAARGAAMFGQGLAIGGLITGGIIAEANRYTKEVEGTRQATAATRQWTQATEDLARVRARVDTILLKEALPLLQQAVKIAEKTADFVEKNPQLVQAALKTGVVVAGLSAVGLAVTKGIKLVADTAYITAVATELLAAKIHERAANKELAAASKGLITNRADDLRAALNVGKNGGFGAGGLGGGLAGAATSPAGSVAIITGFVASTLALSKALQDAKDNIVELGAKVKAPVMVIAEGIAALDTVAGTINPLAPAIKNLREQAARDIPLIVQLFQRLTGASDEAAGRTGGGRTGSHATGRSTTNLGENFGELLKAYEDYKADDLALVQEHYQERQGIIKDALAQETAANQQYANSVAKVNTSLRKSLDSAAADYNKANARAEQQYQQQRFEIIRDGNQQIEQMERDGKERLAQLERDYQEQRSDIIGRRDALALAKLDNKHEQDMTDAKRQAQQEIRERRAAIAQRLADLQQSYEQERAQRAADYQERIAELRANAAEQLKELATEHQEEIKRIREQKLAKLKEMDQQFVDERKRRYQYMIQQIKDLDASLLGMRKIQLNYQAQMQADFESFLARLRAGTASLSSGTTGSTGATSGTHDYTGYAYPGLYKMAQSGQREFVLSGPDTKIAEKIIGNQLNAANLMGALQLIGGNRNMQYVDQRRIDQPVSKWDKRVMEEIAVGAMKKVMG